MVTQEAQDNATSLKEGEIEHLEIEILDVQDSMDDKAFMNKKMDSSNVRIVLLAQNGAWAN